MNDSICLDGGMDDLLNQMRRHVAYTSVGASTVRGQRTPGLVARLRELLSEIDLSRMASCEPQEFPSCLDAETERIKTRMPVGVRHWGIARKVVNIFLRAATYNHFLRCHFKLDRLEHLLEVPLDSLTVKGLKRKSQPRSLPRWTGVKHLRAKASVVFQERAREIASKRQLARVHLDIYLWLDRG